MKIKLLGLGALFAMAPAYAADLDATIQWSRRTELALPVSGVVARVEANAGQRVAQGRLLLALDETPFLGSVNEAQAQLARRKIEHDEATRDAKQAQELYERTVLSNVEIENARMKLARAEAGYNEAKAILDRARYRQKVSALRASFDLVVLSRHVEPGQAVSAELKPPVLLVVAAAGEYLAQARVPAERVTGLKLGQSVTVDVAGKTYTAALKAWSHDPAGGKEPYLLEALFSTTETLYAGQPARLRWP